MNSEKIIDWTYLKSISPDSDKLLKKMLVLFLEQTPEVVHNLEKNFRNRDWKAVQATAHKLKASFVFLGVKEIPEIIESVEVYAGNQIHLDLLPDLIIKIKNVFNKVMTELETERTFLNYEPGM
jgi:HPt (histidine-containing phosphotransfer) domain-containing protein